jgi:DnaJ-class molecular chaperone
LALKYHPKNNSAPEAATKFADVAKAYEEIIAMKS